MNIIDLVKIEAKKSYYLKRTYQLIMIMLIIFGLFLGLRNKENNKIIINGESILKFNKDDYPKPSSQKVDKRTFKNINLKKIFSFSEGKGFIIANVRHIKSDKNGFIYLFDWGDFYIKKFSKDGQFLAKFGKGKGAGPGELSNPTDFDIDDKGNVWIVDPALQRINIFDLNNKLLKTIRLRLHVSRISTLEKNEGYILKMDMLLDTLFTKYDMQDNPEIAFGRLSPDQLKMWLVFDGYTDVDRNNNLYFSFFRAGLLLSYSSDGQLRFFIKTIDQVPMAKVIYFNKGVDISGSYIDRKAPFTGVNINIDKSNIYIYDIFGSKKENCSVIDQYDTKDGSYICSYKLPEKITCMYFSEESIYTIEGINFTKYKIE